ncbi:hypothetical protein [Aliirhizobium smilacinae]|uniref:Uncharacterized protein n=1 Tax=Aliirhizobium smilacinae TaxID=1395944 RepID=A0A5C4XSZ1_9HYPH|nr:hypothetical protein [Rhizobium smilacinae]TNM66482.1 hypothetical protein FHP24_09870 [Rhizobium smilacinae]
MSKRSQISDVSLSISELRRAAMVADEYINFELSAGNGGNFSDACTLTSEQADGIVYMLRHLRNLAEQLGKEVENMCQGKGMNRRMVRDGGLVAAVTSHTTVSTADIADPLLEMIQNYRRSLKDFNENAPHDDEGADAYGKRSWFPVLVQLNQWSEPAASLQGATEALRIAISDENGVYGSEAADRMVKAALGYLEAQL